MIDLSGLYAQFQRNLPNKLLHFPFVNARCVE